MWYLKKMLFSVKEEIYKSGIVPNVNNLFPIHFHDVFVFAVIHDGSLTRTRKYET